MISKSVELPPLPEHDAWCAKGLCSAFYKMTDSTYQILRRKNVNSSYITLTIRGAGFFRDETGRAQKVEAGMLTYLPPRVMQNYGIWPREVWHFHWAHVRCPIHWQTWLETLPKSKIKHLRLLATGSARQLADLSDIFFQLHDRSGATILATSPLEEALALNSLERLFLAALRDATPSTQSQDARVLRSLRTIESRPFDPPSIKELASDLSMSPSRLGHLFKQHTGEPVRNVLNVVRLRQAKALLADPNLSLQSVAEIMKFSNAYSFSKWFFKVSEVRPGAFRKMFTQGVDSQGRNRASHVR